MQPSRSIGTNPLQFQCPDEVKSLTAGIKNGTVVVKKQEGVYTVSVKNPLIRSHLFQSIQIGNIEILTNCTNMLMRNNEVTVCTTKVPMNPELIDKALSCANEI